jgi:DNA/RNA endonuclease G (NUC1)
MFSRRVSAVAAVLVLASCDRLAVTPEALPTVPAPVALRLLECEATVASPTVRCSDAAPGAGRATLIGGQGTYVQLRSSDVSYNSGTGIFSFNATVQNLLPQAMGTRDGLAVDSLGIRVFFLGQPTVTGGSGSASVANPTGVGTFTGSGQPYFQYTELLAPGDTSNALNWQLNVPSTATTFSFSVAVATQVAPALIIYEVMPNPSGVVDTSGEWFEIYNRGLEPVSLAGWRIASANDAGHVIADSIMVPSRGVVVLSNNANTGTNGGVPAAYQYASVTLNNSNSDWIALRTPSGASHDSVHWGGGASVPTAASRELNAPELDNTILMGANWTTSTSNYGTLGDKGTPGTAGGGDDPLPLGPATSVVISPSATSNATGTTRQFSAVARDSNNNVVSTTFTWTSTVDSVASVNASGLASALRAGTTSIIVTAATGVADTATLTVFVQPTSSVFRNHVEFGVPMDADSANEILLFKTEFALSYSRVRGGPNWVAWNLNATHFGDAERCDCFSPDPQLPDSIYKVVTGDYTGSGFSRGHMVMSEQRTQNDAENARTFLMTNILPQLQDMNGGPWLQFEIYANDLARISNKELWNIAGGLYSASPATLNNAGRVQIPTHTWKILVVMNSGQGLANVTSASDITVYAVSMPNQSGIQGNPWQGYKVTVDALEAATGYDFLAALPDAIEAAVESSIAP